jgi:hypothetical protein
VPNCAKHLLHKTQKAIFELGSFQCDVGSEMYSGKVCQKLIGRNLPEIPQKPQKSFGKIPVILYIQGHISHIIRHIYIYLIVIYI